MATIQQLMDEGEARGEARGERRVLTRLLARRFGALTPDVEARLAAAGQGDLERWAERVLDAVTVEDVFGDG